MKWICFKIKTTVDAADIIISSLYDMGLEGAQIEDRVPLTALEKEQMFVDILPDGEEDDGIACLSFFTEKTEDGQLELAGERMDASVLQKKIALELEQIRQFTEIGEGTVSISETEDLDWINNWKQFFHQFYIDDILVVPSWEEIRPADQDKIILHIDPGTAFGTGMHETTQLCVRQLRKYVRPDTRILDVGCGSGILSILSVMFGAVRAVGTDLDPCAVQAVTDNKKVNGIRPDQFDMITGNLITDEKVREAVGFDSYDIVVANILPNVLVPLTPVIVKHLIKGGIYITSGILRDGSGISIGEEAVLSAVKDAGMEILEVTCQGEWVSVTARL